MPPAGRRGREPAADGFATWLESELDREAAAHPNPGRPADHRLNQAEYSNAIRDLLALDINAGSLLPADESDHGFDNIADVLSISPTLLERYMFAAQKISRLAVGDPTIAPAIETFNISRSLRQNERMHEDLPYSTRGGTLIRHYFPLEGEYVVKVRLLRNYTNSAIRAIDTREQIDVLLDGAQITRFVSAAVCTGGSEDPRCSQDEHRLWDCRNTSSRQMRALEIRFAARRGVDATRSASLRQERLGHSGSGPALLPPRHKQSTYEAPQMDME